MMKKMLNMTKEEIENEINNSRSGMKSDNLNNQQNTLEDFNLLMMQKQNQDEEERLFNSMAGKHQK